MCAPGFAGPNCSVECPGPAHNRCFGHGICRDTSGGDGRCECAPGWYGRACSIGCESHRCFPTVQYPPPHAVCEPGTGRCICQQNATGRWAGPTCNRCLAGYWGPACDQLCACSGHGTCGWLDGECECYRDASRGYWAGPACGACAEGFLPPHCRLTDVRVARAMQLSRLVAESNGDLLSDYGQRLLYIGGSPLLVFDPDTARTVATVELRGQARAGIVHRGLMWLLVEERRTRALRVFRLRRGSGAARVGPPLLVLPAARRFRPLAAPAPSYLRLFAYQGLVYALAFRDAALTVVALPPDASAPAPAPLVVLSAASLGLDVVRASAFHCPAGPCPSPPDTAAALLLVGARDGDWHAVALALPPTGSLDPVGDRLRPQLPHSTCAGGVAVEGDTLYVGLEAQGRVLMAAFALGAGDNASLSQSHALPDAEAVQGLTVDALTAAVFVAVRTAAGPSALFKLRAASLVPYGMARMGLRGGAPERIRALVPAPHLRRLYALMAVRGRAVVATFLLAAAFSVVPPLASTAGGTALTIAGEGFEGRAFCRFAGGGTTPATRLSPRAVTCRTAFVTSEGACEGEAVEVQLEGMSTANGVRLRRFPTPTLLELLPRRGFYARAQVLHVRGYGFVASPFVVCRIVAPGHRVAGPGTVLSPSEMLCHQPELDGPLRPPSYLEVAMDGQVCASTVQGSGSEGDHCATGWGCPADFGGR